MKISRCRRSMGRKSSKKSMGRKKDKRKMRKEKMLLLRNRKTMGKRRRKMKKIVK